MKKNKGISLIVLVITIIVIIILAGAVILSLADNNPIKKANEATFKSNVAAYNSELAIAISNMYLQAHSFIPSSFNATVWDGTESHIAGSIKEFIPGITVADGAKFSIQSGNLVYIGTDELEKNACSDLNITVPSVPYLTSITVNGTSSAIQPPFNKKTLEYNINVQSNDSSITITPTAELATSTIKINNINVASGTSSQPINLNYGSSNIIKIEVSGQDGNKLTYTINVTRPYSPYLISMAVNYTGRGISGSADISCNLNDLQYATTVPAAASSVTISAITIDPLANIKVNDVPVDGNGLSHSIPISAGVANFISVVVTAQDGVTRNYDIRVTKLP